MSLSKPHFFPSVWLLFVVGLAGFCLAFTWTPLQADEVPDTRDQFVELDSEIQSIKEAVLSLNQEIQLLEEASLFPRGEQLVVLVSVAQGDAFKPVSIALDLDGIALSRHDYRQGEHESLQAGGVHRLYAGTLSEGEHRLGVLLSGTSERGKAFHEQRSITIIKKPGKKYLELQLTKANKGSAPGLTINEWQQ